MFQILHQTQSRSHAPQSKGLIRAATEYLIPLIIKLRLPYLIFVSHQLLHLLLLGHVPNYQFLIIRGAHQELPVLTESYLIHLGSVSLESMNDLESVFLIE